MTKNEIAKKEENSNELLFSTNDQELMAQMSADAENYIDDTDVEDLSMPRIRILQSNSEQTKKSNTAEYVKGAEEGDFFNTLTSELFKAEKGVFFVPVKRRIVYLEWRDQSVGGGLVNNYGEDPTAYLNANINEDGRKLGSQPNTEIVKTYDFFGYVYDNDKKTFSEVVLSMSKTQVKKAKKFNAMIRSLSDKKTGKQLPEYAGVYKLTTVPESNDKGSWFNYEINFVGFTLALPEVGKTIYSKAKDFADMIRDNSIKTDYQEETIASDKI